MNVNPRVIIVVDRGKHTLMITRRALTVPKTALAGVALEISFARFKPSIAKFKRGRARSPRFGRSDLGAIVEPGGSWEKVVWWNGCE